MSLIIEDPAGLRFGTFTVIRETQSKQYKHGRVRKVKVYCRCGEEKELVLSVLTSFKVQSCGKQSCVKWLSENLEPTPKQKLYSEIKILEIDLMYGKHDSKGFESLAELMNLKTRQYVSEGFN